MNSLFLLLACASEAQRPAMGPDPMAPAAVPVAGPGQAVAVFAGGCFWCMESDFDSLPGVVATTSGYAGGKLKNPTYSDVTSERSGHQEVVHVVYDTTRLSYPQLLDFFWHHIDPTDAGGSFCDRGDSYRSVVFVADEAQKTAAEQSKAAIEASGVLGKPIATPIVSLDTFWPAENYHQNYHETNPGRYMPYRMGCGRDSRVAEVWKKAP
jgi:peptide-methionine (S)-S-oxide reductase